MFMTFPIRLAGLVLCAWALLSGTVRAQETGMVAEAHGLRLHSHFWPNLHHTLYAAAWATRPDTGRRRGAGEIREPLVGPLTADERRAWDAAVSYYDRELASRDLLFGEGMTALNVLFASAAEDLPSAGLGSPHRQTLIDAASVYRKYWWPAHDKANREYIADVLPRLQAIAPQVTARLARLYETPWFREPVRVDVVRVGKSQGAYTSLDPVPLIVISSGEPDYSEWSGAEMLFHEASHALVRPVSQRIRDVARASGKSLPDLWHVVLFYTTGEVVRQTLETRGVQYTPYLYATGLFDRAWPRFRQAVEREWRPYVDGKTTMDDAVKRLVGAL